MHVAERAEREERQNAVAAGEGDLRRLEAHWGEMCGDERYVARRKELEEAKIALEDVRALEAREWMDLAARFQEVGLEFHLKTFDLEFARIPGLRVRALK